MSETSVALDPPPSVRKKNVLDRRITIAGAVLAFAAVCSALAPALAPFDPIELNVTQRLRPPSAQHFFGTDAFGRDVFSRTLYGGQLSLAVGLVVAFLTTVIGLLLGLISGMFRWADAVIMRIMDGLMAIPGILVAIAMMAVARASLATVVLAITTAEVPRMVRVVRSVVLTIREQPYIEAATATGTRMRRIIWRHVLPNTFAPVIVQASFVFASAVLIEAYLSFLGAGLPPDIPSWGNVMAEGRNHIRQAIWILLFPGICLGIVVLAINMLGDGLRDALDPRYPGRSPR